MKLRTTRKTVTFARPFYLRGIDGIQPAGSYAVDTDEELMEGLSFAVWRRVATVMFLPAYPSSLVQGQIATIDPLELQAAQARDSEGA
jgi:hypothetical protein